VGRNRSQKNTNGNVLKEGSYKRLLLSEICDLLQLGNKDPSLAGKQPLSGSELNMEGKGKVQKRKGRLGDCGTKFQGPGDLKGKEIGRKKIKAFFLALGEKNPQHGLKQKHYRD